MDTFEQNKRIAQERAETEKKRRKAAKEARDAALKARPMESRAVVRARAERYQDVAFQKTCAYVGCDHVLPARRRKFCSDACRYWFHAVNRQYSDAYHARKHRREIRMSRSGRALARIYKRPGSTFRLG